MARRNSFPITAVEDYHPSEVRKIMNNVITQRPETVLNIPRLICVVGIILGIILGVFYGIR